jgi:thioesterase domain-containing protein
MLSDRPVLAGPKLFDLRHPVDQQLRPAELEQYLHDHIPLSRAMAVSVVSVAPHGVVLRAPLAPNINHRETVFGGSASALAILAAWSLLHTRLHSEGIASRLVIQRNTMEYEQPILGDFTARSFLEQPTDWTLFTRMLARKGRARISVASVLEHAGQEVGKLHGEFVALGGRGG